MTCLIDYIGIRICVNPEGGVYDITPESNVWINTLPGISLESIDKTANSEQITYLGVWSDAQKEAAVRFKIDFISEIQRCYKLSRDCDYEEMICENKEVLVNAWRYLLGNQLMLFRLYTTRLNRFTTVDLPDAEKLRDFYQVEYEKALRQAAQLVDISTCTDICCSGNPETVYWLP